MLYRPINHMTATSLTMLCFNFYFYSKWNQNLKCEHQAAQFKLVTETINKLFTELINIL